MADQRLAPMKKMPVSKKNVTQRRGAGIYAPGKARIEQILRAAHQILVSDGYSSVTLREIARRCKVRVGAISYYYKRREDLVRDLLEWAAEPYFNTYDSLVEDLSLSAEDRFRKLLRIVLEDIQTENTTRLFPELWAMANHDPFVAKLVDGLYVRQRSSFGRLIAELNPRLGAKERDVLALFVSSSLEGTTMFVGYRKPWSKKIASVENIALYSMVPLVRGITNEEIRRKLTPLQGPTPELPVHPVRKRKALPAIR
jgi:AcrR family transcriptional regulator